ncbi:MAG TPA: hypothetical protein VNQ73_10775 [Ilumatobacter sp.]|nr:hypothetical protein [Ilumatobacter sp.]
MYTSPPDMTARELSGDPSSGLHRFRAPTFDEAVALANAELGEHVEVVEANRIRRGGLGGFFATDLGIEVVVRAVTPARLEPLPLRRDGAAGDVGGSAIDRLLALVDAQERAAHGSARGGGASADFGAVLARELAEPAPMATTVSTDDWSVEAYRRLAIPAEPAPAASVDPSIDRAPMARGRRHPDPELAHRVGEAARAAVECANNPDGAEPPFVVAARAATPMAEPVEPAALAAAPARPSDASSQTMDLVTQAATTLFGQLGTMEVVAGSQAAHVRKLTVSVTSPLGKVIEISAELGA